MYEDKTYEALVAEAIQAAPAGIDTRPNSIYYDAVSAILLVIAGLYADISNLNGLYQLPTASGVYLDELGTTYGVTRNTATSAEYPLVYTGAPPQNGSRFFDATTGAFFESRLESGSWLLVAEIPGAAANGVTLGAAAVPARAIPGMTSAAFGEIARYGTDVEADDDFRRRMREKIAGPAEVGNAQHYKTWCEEVDGVGRAYIIPLWNGANTVKGVIFSAEGTAVSGTVIAEVQAFIDPGSTGLGEGAAPIGAIFTAVSATEVTVDVSVSVALAAGALLADAQTQIQDALAGYFTSIALGGSNVIRYAEVGAVLLDQPAVLDYTGLTLGGGTGNVQGDDTQALILGIVTVGEA